MNVLTIYIILYSKENISIDIPVWCITMLHKTMKKNTRKTIGGIIGLTLLMYLTVYLEPQLFSFAQKSSTNNDNSNELYLLSKSIENRLEKAAAILELASKMPEVRHTSFSNQFNLSINGIPSNADMEKRQMAKNMLSEYPQDLVSVLFLMPNGTVYMLEPYDRQLNLTTSDLSFRDYYKGVINTKDTFLGNVITSASSGLKQAQLAVPVIDSKDNNTLSLKGILASGLNLEIFNEMLNQSSNLINSKERILLVDNNGIKIADSNRELSHKNESFANVQGFKNAINGQSGSIMETINGTKMSVSYHPIDAISHKWAILFIQPNGNGTVNSTTTNFSIENTYLSKQKQGHEEITLQNTSMSKPALSDTPGQLFMR